MEDTINPIGAPSCINPIPFTGSLARLPKKLNSKATKKPKLTEIMANIFARRSFAFDGRHNPKKITGVMHTDKPKTVKRIFIKLYFNTEKIKI